MKGIPKSLEAGQDEPQWAFVRVIIYLAAHGHPENLPGWPDGFWEAGFFLSSLLLDGAFQSCFLFKQFAARAGRQQVIAHNYTVFNICGNKFRLIVQIRYGDDLLERDGTIFIKDFLTHNEYDMNNWKQVLEKAQIATLDPIQALQIQMSNRNLKQADLAPVIGSKSHVSKLLAGKRDLSKTRIQRLSEFFRASPEVFLPLSK